MYIPFSKDTLQKISFMAFAQAMLVMMEDTRKVIGFYPTELIIPTFRHRFMDGVLELDDGTLMNFEFQEGNLTEKFLLRCAQYAINLRIIGGKLVETIIISTGTRKKSKLAALISKFFPFKPKIFFYNEFDGLEKLISIKNKIENNEKLTLLDQYYLVFIPLMGNVDSVKVAFEVFNIANTENLFAEDELENIKKCQYIMAYIIAEDDEKLFNEFVEIIKMNNNLMDYYEKKLIDKITKDVTESVTESVTKSVTKSVTESVTERVTTKIAKNLKEVLSDEVIATYTGLSIDKIKQL